nr:cyclin-A1-4 isoform X2 [Tanacetum cinerariifolium]
MHDDCIIKDEVLQMEMSVINFLNFEMTAPTVRCFLRRFVRSAQGVNEAPSMHLEHLASYIAKLSLLEYDVLQYAPSLVAASAIFLARYVQSPSQKLWDSTLRHYTQYQPSDLSECVKALHALVCECPNSSLPAIQEKYSPHKEKMKLQRECRNRNITHIGEANNKFEFQRAK